MSEKAFQPRSEKPATKSEERNFESGPNEEDKTTKKDTKPTEKKERKLFT